MGLISYIPKLNFFIEAIYIYIYIYILSTGISKAYGAGCKCNPSEPPPSSFSSNILRLFHHTPLSLTPSAVNKYTTQLNGEKSTRIERERERERGISN
jgi:hypothetical protein